MATLAYTIHIEGLSDDAFVVRQFDGQESLSHSTFHQRPCYGFCYHIDLASRQPNLTAEQMVDRSVELRFYRDQAIVQRVHGIVRAFTQGDIGHSHTFYSLTLVPALERLSLRHNSRIFQYQTVPDILATLLQEMGIHDYAFSLERTCTQREFCVQYRESDLDFLHRLAAEEGMVYSFEHEVGKHTLVFHDASALCPSLAEPIPYNAVAGGVMDTPYINRFHYQSQTQVSEVELKDYSFKKPAYSFSQRAQGAEMASQPMAYTHFDAPGRYKDDANGMAFSRIRLGYLRREAQLASGLSNEPRLRAGVKFTLQEHLNPALNRTWLLVAVTRQGHQPQALEEEAGHGATTYANQWQAIPGDGQWQAEPEPKPTVDGPMIATVVGPDGEEIFCDDYGRVKVHFHWDRSDTLPEHRSCWVRVSQGWAGNQYGMMAIPRVGHEVIVSFLNGDPDQPIITGRTYSAATTPAYALPEHKTKTVWRSQTHQGEGYNELSFEDQADQELIYLRAQKNMQVEVENSAETRIQYDHVVHIGHNDTRTIAQDRTLTVEGKQQHTTVGDHLSEIQGDEHASVLGDWAKKVSGAMGINADGDITFKSGNKITLQVGGSFVVIDNSGVAVNGTQILLNSGGSPGALPMPSSPEMLTAAACDGSAFVANCPGAGRWLSADPAGTVDGLNLFRMVRNNPVTFLDSDGLMPHPRTRIVGSNLYEPKLNTGKDRGRAGALPLIPTSSENIDIEGSPVTLEEALNDQALTSIPLITDLINPTKVTMSKSTKDVLTNPDVRDKILAFNAIRFSINNNETVHALRIVDSETPSYQTGTRVTYAYWVPQGGYADIPAHPQQGEPSLVFTPGFSGCTFVADKLNENTIRVRHVQGAKEDIEYNNLAPDEHGQGMIDAMEYQLYGYHQSESGELIENITGSSFMVYEDNKWNIKFQSLAGAPGIVSLKEEITGLFFQRTKIIGNIRHSAGGRVVNTGTIPLRH